MNITEIWNKIWRDRHGKIVIWQTPNIPLIGWLVFTVISLLISGTGADVTQYIGIAFLAVWSLLELVLGVNYFRRALGLLVLISTVATIIHIV